MNQPPENNPKPRRVGQVIPLDNGKYKIKIFLGYDSEGKKEYFSKTLPLGTTSKQADKFLRDKLREKEHGLDLRASKLSLGEYLDHWLKSVKTEVKLRTYTHYETILQLYIRPKLAKVRLDKLTALHLQEAFSDLAEKGLSGVTRKHAYVALKFALNQAVELGLLLVNPLNKLKPPRKESKEMQALSWEEAEMFMVAAAENRYFMVFALALVSGMRPGEYLGLQKQDLDLDEGKIYVRRTLCRKRKKDGGGWYFEEPKTKKGKRVIDLPPKFVEILREHERAMDKKRGASRERFVFTNSVGSPIDRRDIVKREFKQIQEKSGIEKPFRLYDLRHTMATLMLLRGTHMKVVSERLGHASVAITLDVYGHVLPGMQKEAVQMFDAFLTPSGGSIGVLNDGNGGDPPEARVEHRSIREAKAFERYISNNNLNLDLIGLRESWFPAGARQDPPKEVVL